MESIRTYSASAECAPKLCRPKRSITGALVLNAAKAASGQPAMEATFDMRTAVERVYYSRVARHAMPLPSSVVQGHWSGNLSHSMSDVIFPGGRLWFCCVWLRSLWVINSHASTVANVSQAIQRVFNGPETTPPGATFWTQM